MVSAKVDGNRTQYTGWFYVPEFEIMEAVGDVLHDHRWPSLSGLYSFVEDFNATDIRRHWSAKQSTAKYGRWAWMGSGSKGR